MYEQVYQKLVDNIRIRSANLRTELRTRFSEPYHGIVSQIYPDGTILWEIHRLIKPYCVIWRSFSRDMIGVLIRTIHNWPSYSNSTRQIGNISIEFSSDNGRDGPLVASIVFPDGHDHNLLIVDDRCGDNFFRNMIDTDDLFYLLFHEPHLLS